MKWKNTRHAADQQKGGEGKKNPKRDAQTKPKAQYTDTAGTKTQLMARFLKIRTTNPAAKKSDRRWFEFQLAEE